MNNLEEVLYLNPLELSGPEQMAIDLFLLEKSLAEKNFNMAVRFYTWDGEWLSIGKNQKELPKKWIELLKNEQLKIVRRPSGGKAVLHSRGLTYALIWKYPPRNKKESYLKTTQWLKDGIKKLVVTTNGYKLDQIAGPLIDTGVDGINISIDTLDRKKFKEITGHDRLPEILKGIEILYANIEIYHSL